MFKSTTVLLFLAGCAGEKTCGNDQYLSASGDCEDRQEGGNPGGGFPAGDDTGAIDTGGYDTGGGGDDTGGGGGDVYVDIDWSSSGVRLVLYGMEASYSLFGMAQTGVDEGWTGEDCLYGYAGYFYCHAFEGDQLDLETVEDLDYLYAGETTLFSAEFEDEITYYVYDYSSGYCYTWGDDPSYYIEGNYCIEL